MPTLPSHQGWHAHHSMVSAPSAASFANGSKSPSEVPVPRQCWMTTASPASTAGITGAVRIVCSPYGLRISSAGNGPPSVLRYTSARRTVPSRIGIGLSCSTRTDTAGIASLATITLPMKAPRPAAGSAAPLSRRRHDILGEQFDAAFCVLVRHAAVAWQHDQLEAAQRVTDRGDLLDDLS